MIGKKTIAIVFVVTIGLSLFVGLALAAPGTDPVTQILQILQSMQSIVQNTNNNLSNVKVETVIQGPWINTSEFNFPELNITANQPWDLMAVYVSTKGVSSGLLDNNFVVDDIQFGIYRIGGRIYSSFPTIEVAKSTDAINFPIFAGDMTNRTQSIIAVPPNVPVTVSAIELTMHNPFQGFLVSFKTVIQRPLDPNFSFNVTF